MSGAKPRLFHVETFGNKDGCRRSAHFWVGPLGLHLHGRLWHSRFDWEGRWRDGPLTESSPLLSIESSDTAVGQHADSGSAGYVSGEPERAVSEAEPLSSVARTADVTEIDATDGGASGSGVPQTMSPNRERGS